MPARRFLLFVTGLPVVSACGAARPVRYVSVPPPTAQAISLLGDTLWNLSIDPVDGQRRIELLFRARDEVRARPSETLLKVELGRRTEGVGRFREAVGIYTEVIANGNMDPRWPRYRGETLIRIRELDAAISDLALAARRSMSQGSVADYAEAPDGSTAWVTSLKFSTYFFLGVAHYLKGEFATARSVLHEAAEHALTADDVVRVSLWLFFVAVREQKVDEAGFILGLITPDLPTISARPEHRLLLAYQGGAAADSLPVDMTRPPRDAAEATYGYGIGFGHLMLGRRDLARSLFEQVIRAKDWSTLSYLAAESELTRLRAAEKP